MIFINWSQRIQNDSLYEQNKVENIMEEDNDETLEDEEFGLRDIVD